MQPGSGARIVFAVGSILAAAVAAAAEWTDTARDVYVDGRLDRAAQVFAERGSQRLAVVAGSLPRIVVFDRGELAVGWLERQHLAIIGDGTSAGSVATPEPDGEATLSAVDDGSYLLSAAGHTVLVALRQGPAGEIGLDELWRTVPLWKRLADAYEPDAKAVAQLAASERDVDLEVIFGTWCGDSKHYVPQLLKTLRLAANPAIHLRLATIRRGFAEPLGLVHDRRLTNVPTVIVSANGREIGRIVETPAGATIEGDLAAILAGETPAHQGRWSRDRRLARGAYRYADQAGKETGTEEWEIFADGDDRLLHCRTRLGDRATEVWQRLDPHGETTFVEITREGPGELSRSRHWIEDGRLRSVVRGNTTGVVEQQAELPPGTVVLAPAAAAALQGCPGAADGGVRETSALRLAGAGEPATGLLEPLSFQRLGRREIETPAGRLTADQVERHAGSTTSRWWRHPRLGIPVAGQIDGAGEVVLTELEIFDSAAPDP